MAGASKRGWTSWLTAAVDPRVASVAPIAIDMLNLPAQIALQHETFGGLSEQVQDYVAIDLPGRVATERGRSLIVMVDPYQYLADLTPPKLIDGDERNPRSSRVTLDVASLRGYPKFPLATVVCIASETGGDAPDC